MYCSTPAFSALHYLRSLFKFMSIESMMLSSHLILCLCLLICIQSFPTSVSFPMSCLFSSSGPSIRAWASASVLPMNIQDWFPLGWTGLISVQFKWLSWVFSNITVQKHQFFSTQPSLCTNSHILTWLGKTTALTLQTVVSKVMSLLSNTLSRFVKDFLPRSKCLWISWLKSPSTVILELKKIKSASTFLPSLCHGVMGADAMILVFWI